MVSMVERVAMLRVVERERADVLRVQAAAYTLADIVDRLRDDDRRGRDRERDRLGQLLECAGDQLVFTSGATEGANAVWAHLAARNSDSARVWVNPTEHTCVLEAARRWFPGGVELLPVNGNGVVEPAALRDPFRQDHEQPV